MCYVPFLGFLPHRIVYHHRSSFYAVLEQTFAIVLFRHSLHVVYHVILFSFLFPQCMDCGGGGGGVKRPYYFIYTWITIHGQHTFILRCKKVSVSFYFI